MATARPKGRGYEIRVSMGYDMNGKKITKSKTWVPPKNLTQKQLAKELERQKVLFEEEVKTGNCPTSNMRFKDYSDMWCKEYGEKFLAPKTYYRYCDYLKRINQAIGNIKLQDLTPIQLNRFYQNLAEDGVSKKVKKDKKGNVLPERKLSPKTIREHHVLISSMLKRAVKWNLIKENIAYRADPPRANPSDIDFLDEKEIQAIISALESEPITYKTMIVLIFFTGMRRGELFGLEWKDIDFDNNTLKIERTSQYIGNKTIITKGPKTRSGHREIYISQSLVRVLKKYRAWQAQRRLDVGSDWNDTDRLFTQWNGKPMYPDSLTKWFSKFLERNNLRKVTLHSLRHTNATIMIAEGTDIRTVSNRLGHAQTSTTLNIYTHALKSKDEQAAEVLDNVLAM